MLLNDGELVPALIRTGGIALDPDCNPAKGVVKPPTDDRPADTGAALSVQSILFNFDLSQERKGLGCHQSPLYYCPFPLAMLNLQQ